MSGADSACRAGRRAAGGTPPCSPSAPRSTCACHGGRGGPAKFIGRVTLRGRLGVGLSQGGEDRCPPVCGEEAPVTGGGDGTCVLQTGRTGRRSHVEWRRGPSGGSRRRVTSSLSPHSLLAYVIARLAADPRPYHGPRRDGVFV